MCWKCRQKLGKQSASCSHQTYMERRAQYQTTLDEICPQNKTGNLTIVQGLQRTEKQPPLELGHGKVFSGQIVKGAVRPLMLVARAGVVLEGQLCAGARVIDELDFFPIILALANDTHNLGDLAGRVDQGDLKLLKDAQLARLAGQAEEEMDHVVVSRGNLINGRQTDCAATQLLGRPDQGRDGLHAEVDAKEAEGGRWTDEGISGTKTS